MEIGSPKQLLIAGATVAAAALVSESARAQQGKLLVFLHVAMKQRALQSELQAALGAVEVTAVGRIADFERALSDGADAVLSLPPLLSQFKLTAKLKGVRGSSTEEAYCLAGVGAEPVPGKLTSVGALDLLGRDGTAGFVKDLLQISPRIERVSKVEDLLPLLQMQRADAVLLPSRLFAEIKAASKLALVHKELSKTVGLPSVASVKAGGDAIVAAITKMPIGMAKKLGVDSWR